MVFLFIFLKKSYIILDVAISIVHIKRVDDKIIV